MNSLIYLFKINYKSLYRCEDIEALSRDPNNYETIDDFLCDNTSEYVDRSFHEHLEFKSLYTNYLIIFVMNILIMLLYYRSFPLFINQAIKTTFNFFVLCFWSWMLFRDIPIQVLNLVVTVVYYVALFVFISSYIVGFLIYFKALEAYFWHLLEVFIFLYGISYIFVFFAYFYSLYHFDSFTWYKFCGEKYMHSISLKGRPTKVKIIIQWCYLTIRYLHWFCPVFF